VDAAFASAGNIERGSNANEKVLLCLLPQQKNRSHERKGVPGDCERCCGP
jgi:hypothetical protein